MHRSSSSTFGDLLRRYRLSAGLTQEALAERTGLGVRSIQHLEGGAHLPHRETVLRLTQGLGLTGAERNAFDEAAQPTPRQRAAVSRVSTQQPGPAPHHNLPRQLTSFVGRERELAEVARLLARSPLVTLTGGGGCGKTRLALQVAADLLDASTDGVWFVDLAPLADPALVPQTVMATLGVSEAPGRSPLAVLVDYLRRRHLLLVLDNCEHLIDAAAQLVASLLPQCARLLIVATSREMLGVPGEVVWRVPSLSLPNAQSPLSIDELGRSEAVRLFVERARLVQPVFAVTSRNAAALAQVCQRLDGIPLAIELAAARTKLLTIDQIRERLHDRFRLLTRGSRTALRRQQTLQASIDWSFDLLADVERMLLRRLAVFAGGWTLAAIEGICTGGGLEPDDTLDLLSRLVDKSLVVAEGQDEASRYRLLDTIRHYAAEKLGTGAEATQMRIRHRDWYLALVELAEEKLIGPEQGEWFDRLEQEHDNLRLALGWSLDDREHPDAALRLAGALFLFWLWRGYTVEGKLWLDRVLAVADHGPAALRAKAQGAYAYLSYYHGEREGVDAAFQEALTTYRAMGDQRGIAHMLGGLGMAAANVGDRETAHVRHEEMLANARGTEDRGFIAYMLVMIGRDLVRLGDYVTARPLLEESLALSRAAGNHWLTAMALGQLGHLALARGDDGAARVLHEESIQIKHNLKIKRGIAYSLTNLARLACRRADFPTARVMYGESLLLFQQTSDNPLLSESLEGCANLAAAQGEHAQAVRLFGSVANRRMAIGVTRPASDQAESGRTLATARQVLGDTEFARAWAEGQAMTLEQAVAYALEGNAG